MIQKKTIDGLLQLKQYHIQIVKNLFGNDSFEIEETINKLFEELSGFLNTNKSPNYSFVYDQVVSIGELLSSKIVHAFMKFSDWRIIGLIPGNVLKLTITIVLQI